MARTVQARLDARADEDLAVLRNEGHNDSDAIRLALHEAADVRRRRSALLREAEAAAWSAHWGGEEIRAHDC